MAYSIERLKQELNLSNDVVESILNDFTEDDGEKEIDQLKVDEDGKVVSFGFNCTKPGCNCTGGWWTDIAQPLGNTFIVNRP